LIGRQCGNLDVNSETKLELIAARVHRAVFCQLGALGTEYLPVGSLIGYHIATCEL